MPAQNTEQSTGTGCAIVVGALVVFGLLAFSLPKNDDGEIANVFLRTIGQIVFIGLIGRGIFLVFKKVIQKENEESKARAEDKRRELVQADAEKESLEQIAQEALNTYRTKAGELAEPHLATLAKKKKRLITFDDYGVPCTERWEKEITYFYDRVLKADVDLLNLETEVIEAQTQLLEYEVFLEEAKDALMRYIDTLINVEIEQTKDEPSEYSDDITPEDYEHFCADILNNCGWLAVVTKGSGDQGIDVVAEKDDFRLAIQCKKYSKPVGNKAVQEAYSGGAFYEANACAVVAPIEYTPSAKELADSLGVHLFHHDDLADLSITAKES